MAYNADITTADPGENDGTPASTAFVQQELGGYLPLTGGALTGALTSTGDITARLGTNPVKIGQTTNGWGIEFSGPAAGVHQLYELSSSTMATRSSIRIQEAGTNSIDLFRTGGITLRRTAANITYSGLANASTNAIRIKVTGDANDRMQIRAGSILWGDGTNVDVTLAHSAANTLQLGAGDQLQVQQDPVADDDVARKAYVDASGVSQLNDLSDVSQTPNTNDILYYNGTNYADITLPTLTEATTDLDDLRDVDFTPAQWDSMYHNGTNWVAIPDAFHGHYCKAYRTGTVGLANSTTTTITLQANAAGDESPTNMFTPSSTQIFVRESGIYFILGQISYVSNATGIRICRLLTNGTQVAYSTQPAHATTSNRVQCGAWASLTAGQYIQMQGYQNSGATRNVNAGISETFLSVALMRRIGDVT